MAKHRERLAQCTRERKAAQVSKPSAMGQIRLTAQDLRNIVVNLHGTAEHLSDEGSAGAATVAGASATVFDVADCIQAFAMQGDREIKLNCEQIDLSFFFDQVIAALRASGNLGVRTWDMAPNLSKAWLLGDARALRHVLTRTLIIVLCGTRRDERIEVGIEISGDTAALTIRGLPGGVESGAHDTTAPMAGRLDGLRLKLAQKLVEAHGGEVRINQRFGMAPEVTISFPADRLSTSAPVDTRVPASISVDRRSHRESADQRLVDVMAD